MNWYLEHFFSPPFLGWSVYGKKKRSVAKRNWRRKRNVESGLRQNDNDGSGRSMQGAWRSLNANRQKRRHEEKVNELMSWFRNTSTKDTENVDLLFYIYWSLLLITAELLCEPQWVNSLAPGRSECDSKNGIFNLFFTDWYLQIFSW